MRKTFVNSMCILLIMALLLGNMPMNIVKGADQTNTGRETVLPLNEEKFPEKEEVKAIGDIVGDFTQFEDLKDEVNEGIEDKATEGTSSIMAEVEKLYLKEDEKKLINTSQLEEYNYYIYFVPQATGFYTISAPSEEVPYIYLYEDNKTIAFNRTYPEKIDTVVQKLHKGQEYKISLNYSKKLPIEMLVKKYKPESTQITYTFVDNTYTGEDKASVVVTIPNLRFDIYHGLMEGDMFFEAELLKNGQLIDSIPVISREDIRGGTGSPDDNIIQFLCQFNKVVPYGEYTIKLTCKNSEGIKVSSCERDIKVGNPVILYIPQNSISFYGSGTVYFNSVNTSDGKLIVMDKEEIVGVSGKANIYTTSIRHDNMFSNYSGISYSNKKFEKTLKYTTLGSVDFKRTLDEDKLYDVKFVAGISEHETNAKLKVTEELILNSVYISNTLYDGSKEVSVTANFYNVNKFNYEDITVELTDLSGKVVATEFDHICRNYYEDTRSAEIIFRLGILEPLEVGKQYNVNIGSKKEMYVNVKSAGTSIYKGSNSLNLNNITIEDASKGIVKVTTYSCNTNLEYDVTLYRSENGFTIPVSQISKVKGDQYGSFSLEFPAEEQRPLIIPGVTYYVEFRYKDPATGVEYKIQSSSQIFYNYFDGKTNKKINFKPSIITSQGQVELEITGTEIKNGILGTDNKNLNIELVGDNEVYGSVIKETINKEGEVINTYLNYSLTNVKIKGTMNITKPLKNGMKYYIKINGQQYEYFTFDDKYSVDKNIKTIEAEEARGFMVDKASYGSDVVTVAVFPGVIEGFSFEVQDGFSNNYSCKILEESIRKEENYKSSFNGSNSVRLIDLKVDKPLNNGKHTFRMFNSQGVLKYTTNYTITTKKEYPFARSVKSGFPYLITGENLPQEGNYTIDIDKYYYSVKKDIPLEKIPGQNSLKLDDIKLKGLPYGEYYGTVKLDGIIIGRIYLKHFNSGKYPFIYTREWLDGTGKYPYISSNKTELLINTMYYTKVRFCEDPEELENITYGDLSDSFIYEFKEKQKTLYFQFIDDFGRETEIIPFKVYTKEIYDITVLSPQIDKTYDKEMTIAAKVTQNPHSVWVKIWELSTDSRYYTYERRLELVKDENDVYSTLYNSNGVGKIAKVEVYAMDKMGSTVNAHSLILKELIPAIPQTPVPTLQIVISKNTQSSIKISGKNATTNSNVEISANLNNITYRTVVVADDKGEFEGTMNIDTDGYYSITAMDSKGIKTSSSNSVRIDTVAPVIKNVSVAQGENSIRILWDVTDANDCRYKLWRDDRLIGEISTKEYLEIGLPQGKKYVYKLMAIDSVGNTSEIVEFPVEVGDTKAPVAPSNIGIVSRSGKSITLSWEASTDNSYVEGYEVYRNGEKIGLVFTPTFKDTGLNEGEEYSYKIKAFDPSKNYSEFSEEKICSTSLNSVTDGYDGSISIVASSIKNVNLKALTTDILNNKNIRMLFEYSVDGGKTWNHAGSQDKFTTTPQGLLFTCIWKVQYLQSGEYNIRYTAEDSDGCKKHALSQKINILKTDDFEKPSIESMTSNTTFYSKVIPVTVVAKDNIELNKVTLMGSLDGLEWKTLTNINMQRSTKYTFSYNVDVSNVREGEYYVKAVAQDAGENVSKDYINKYIVDRTPSEKVKDIYVNGFNDCIEIRWTATEEPFVSGFRVLRSDSADGIYSVIAAKVVALNYFDTTPQKNKEYYYKVICIDLAENLSEPSEPLKGMLSPEIIRDQKAPVISGLYPNNNVVVGSKVEIVVTAKDEVSLSKVTLQYSTDGLEWKDIKSEAYSQGCVELSGGYTAELHTSKYSSGSTITVRAIASDSIGNTSHWEYRTYTIDNVPPKVPYVKVIPKNRSIEIEWGCDEEDITKYMVYRRLSTSPFYTVVGEYNSTIKKCLDKNLDPGALYIYKIVAVDKYTNSSFVESAPFAPLDVDEEAPVAVINGVSSADRGTEVEFSGLESKDNVKIVKYHWDLGDGTIAQGPHIKHTYKEEGVYTLSLVVTDPSSNVCKAEKKINVIGNNNGGTLKVFVLDNMGDKLPYADVYINVGQDNQYKLTSDSTGNISVNLEGGKYKIGVYKEGYSAKQQEVLIENNKVNELGFMISKSDLVVGSMIATKLNLDEIKGAGIDISAPGNQNMFKYQINLQYNNKPYIINHIDTKSPKTYTVGDRNISVSTAGNTGSDKSKSPVVVIIDLPGTATWTKDFFDVKLHVINNQDTYGINNCSVKLNLPEGLTLMGSVPEFVDIKNLAPKESRNIEWLVRGDKVGSYKLSADFRGKLETFNEEIVAKFEVLNPIEVKGQEGLRLKVEVENRKSGYGAALYRVGMINESQRDVNNPNIKMENSNPIGSYKTDLKMSLINTDTKILRPGEIFWTEFSIDSGLFEKEDLVLDKYIIEGLSGLNMPVEIVPVKHGKFRNKIQFFTIDPITKIETLCSYIKLNKYKNKYDDVMPDLKIKVVKNITEDIAKTEEVELTIKESMFGTVKKVKTDANGDYILTGLDIGKLDLSQEKGKGHYTIKVMPSIGSWGEFSLSVYDEEHMLEENEGYFNYAKGYKEKYFYDDFYFLQDSYVYNQQRTTMSLCFAMSAFLSNTYEHPYKSNNARDLLTKVGFKDFEKNKMYEVEPTKDSIGVIAANKKLKMDGEEYTLIAVGVRGQGYGQEWASNFTLGTSGQHQGFNEAKENVIDFLEKYIKTYKIEGKIKLWIAGFSRSAAVTNLVAGDLDGGRSLGSTVSLKPWDLFAYCFEAPAGALRQDVAGKAIYNNIFNIINPSDPVPKVAPGAFGFGRYGVDCNLPMLMDLNYEMYKENMLKKYNLIPSIKEEYIVDEFQAVGLKWEIKSGPDMSQIPGSPIVITPPPLLIPVIEERNGLQGYFLDIMIGNVVKDIFKSRSNYVNEYQEMIRDIMAFLNSNKIEQEEKKDEFERILLQKLTQNKYKIILDYILVINKTGSKLKFIDSLAQIVEESLHESGIMGLEKDEIRRFATTLGELLAKFVKDYFDDVLTMINNTEGMGAAHRPELCLAWMQSMDSNYPDSMPMEFSNGAYRVIKVNCPVDINIYDSHGKLAGSIVSDKALKVEGKGVIPEINKDGEKVFYLSSQGEYSIEIIGTDKGSVNYSINEFFIGVGDYTRTINYFDIGIDKGEILKGHIPSFVSWEADEISKGSSINYTLKGKKEIVPDIDLKGTQASQAFYKVSIEVDYDMGFVTGQGIRQLGSFAKVTAIPNEGYKFAGWYMGDNCVSTEAEYRFCVKEDKTLVVKFTKDNNYTGGSNNTGTPGIPVVVPDGGSGAGVPVGVPAIDVQESLPGTVPGSDGANGEGEIVSKDEGTKDVGEATLKDIKNHWSEKNINTLVGKKIVTGYPDMTFKPENSITRGEAAVIIIKMLGLDPVENSGTGFADDSNIPDWARGYINRAVKEGIIKGYEDNTFKASNIITRAEMSVMIVKALKEKEGKNTLGFKDWDKVPQWAKGFVSKAYELKLVNGYPDNTFRSHKGITRAEVAAIIAKAIE